MDSLFARLLSTGRMPLMGALISLAMSPLARAQITPITVDLVPALPAWRPNSNAPSEPAMREFELNLGDLDGNGVQDLVYSNGLAFCRVYFMKYHDVTGDYEVESHYDVLKWAEQNPPVPCDTSGPGAVGLTVAAAVSDTSLIYDIDLDGRDELIYFEHIESPTGVGEVGLRIYHFTSVGTLESPSGTQHPPTGDLQDLMDPSPDPTPFFGDACEDDDERPMTRKTFRTLRMRVVNVRGRTFPQDIVVWCNHPKETKNVAVYGYDSNDGAGNEGLELLFEHSASSETYPGESWLVANPQWQGSAGHTWRGRDIDYDGKDELIGKHILGYDPELGPLLGKQVRWGIGLKNVDHENTIGVYAPDNHPDHVVALDFIKTYVDPRNPGKILPSPGIEILAAPQTDGTSSSTDRSGPWIYRAISGHDFAPTTPPTQPARYWPIRTLNIAPLPPVGVQSDGGAYSWPSSGTAVLQPDPASGHWDDFLADVREVGGTGVDYKEIGVQLFMPGDFIDSIDGPEIFISSKGGVESDAAPCNDTAFGTPQASFYLMDGTESLDVLGWGRDSDDKQLPNLVRGVSIDFEGTRDQIELQAGTHTFCVNNLQNPDPDQGHAIFRWDSTGGEPRQYAPERINLYQEPPGTSGVYLPGAGYSQQVRDVLGDSREEQLITKLSTSAGNSTGSYDVSTLLVISNPDMSVIRDEPSPVKYLQYRTRPKVGYPEYIDYKSLTGLKLVPGRAPRGTKGMPYGFDQDDALVPPGGVVPQNCLAITVEGGMAPYSISLNPDSALLPLGLTQTMVTGNAYAAQNGGVFCIHGTPVEATSRKITLDVQDFLGQTAELSIWINVDPASGQGVSASDSRPNVYRGGFGAAYLAENMATQVVLSVWVEDLNNDVATVDVYDQSGAMITTLIQALGDRWNGRVDVAPGAAPSTLHYTVIATDAVGNKSTVWPYMTIEGGDGEDAPAYVTVSPSGQSSAETPRIRWVELPRHSIPAAEVSDGTGTQSIKVWTNKFALGVADEVEVVLRHPLIGDEFAYRVVKDVSFGTGANVPYEVDFNTDLFDPVGQFGWGEYTINVRVKFIEPFSQQTYYTDWWPQLTAH